MCKYRTLDCRRGRRRLSSRECGVRLYYLILSQFFSQSDVSMSVCPSQGCVRELERQRRTASASALAESSSFERATFDVSTTLHTHQIKWQQRRTRPRNGERSENKNREIVRLCLQSVITSVHVTRLLLSLVVVGAQSCSRPMREVSALRARLL